MVFSRVRAVACNFAFVCALVLGLLAAPILGSIHQILHSPVGQSESRAKLEAAAFMHASLERLFSHHTDSSDCRLYDQLASGDSMACMPMLALPPVAHFYLLAYFSGEALARWAALFEARGPPFIR